jgi:hypothetical protein
MKKILILFFFFENENYDIFIDRGLINNHNNNNSKPHSFTIEQQKKKIELYTSHLRLITMRKEKRCETKKKLPTYCKEKVFDSLIMIFIVLFFEMKRRNITFHFIVFFLLHK